VAVTANEEPPTSVPAGPLAELERERDGLRALVLALAERVAAQSELLSKRAERPSQPSEEPP
jgi:hypothetical protein